MLSPMLQTVVAIWSVVSLFPRLAVPERAYPLPESEIDSCYRENLWWLCAAGSSTSALGVSWSGSGCNAFLPTRYFDYVSRAGFAELP
jgi:hypothetical protein